MFHIGTQEFRVDQISCSVSLACFHLWEEGFKISFLGIASLQAKRFLLWNMVLKPGSRASLQKLF